MKSVTFWPSWPFNICKRWLGFDKIDGSVSILEEESHPLLKDHTRLNSYATGHARYSAIRTFYHPHPHTDKLKAIADLPLVVTIHGIGGSLLQFAPLLGSFVHFASCFAIELPGHGMSEFNPKNYEAYTFEALVDLWKTAIEDVCQRHGHRQVLLVGHSMGCSIAATLCTMTDQTKMTFNVIGLVAICPKATPPTKQQVQTYRRLLSLPDFVLNILRWFDRLGKEKSKSVKRFVGEAANPDLKRLQLQFNKAFRTAVWKRISIGLLPRYDESGVAHGGLPGQMVWEAIRVPLLLIAGESDVVTKPQEVRDILEFVQGRTPKKVVEGTDQSAESRDIRDEDTKPHADEEHFGLEPSSFETRTRHAQTIRSVVLPSPASHAIMYDHSTYRTVAGLIEGFLAKHVSQELNLGWQLQQLTTSGKWDVKNLEKWKKVTPVSGPIDGGLFRALKTLREQDEEHTPSVFLKKWKGKIFAIIDISHDSPVYDTKALEKGGVQYHKFPTVSKIPPTVVEVQDFISLVDRLREENNKLHFEDQAKPAIGVHCHYGYNRTGFFIVCYLIERCGYKVQDAIEEFARAKPPGIKHDHFIDTLFVRYCVGLRRSSSFR